MATDSVLKGGCQCGAVRYAAAGPLRRISHCHCSMCRQLHGALFVTFGEIAPEAVTWSGEEHVRVYSSSDAIDRRFCGTCGGQLAVSVSGDPDMLYLCLGSLDPGEAPDHDPDHEPHIFWESRVTWYDPGHPGPRVTGYGEGGPS